VTRAISDFGEVVPEKCKSSAPSVHGRISPESLKKQVVFAYPGNHEDLKISPDLRSVQNVVRLVALLTGAVVQSQVLLTQCSLLIKPPLRLRQLQITRHRIACHSSSRYRKSSVRRSRLALWVVNPNHHHNYHCLWSLVLHPSFLNTKASK
jgi:hypothetical protein